MEIFNLNNEQEYPFSTNSESLDAEWDNIPYEKMIVKIVKYFTKQWKLTESSQYDFNVALSCAFRSGYFAKFREVIKSELEGDDDEIV